jgi:hypothetical protein
MSLKELLSNFRRSSKVIEISLNGENVVIKRSRYYLLNRVGLETDSSETITKGEVLVSKIEADLKKPKGEREINKILPIDGKVVNLPGTRGYTDTHKYLGDSQKTDNL